MVVGARGEKRGGEEREERGGESGWRRKEAGGEEGGKRERSGSTKRDWEAGSLEIQLTASSSDMLKIHSPHPHTHTE